SITQYCYRTQTINIFTIFNIAHCNPSPVSPTQDHSQRPKQKKIIFYQNHLDLSSKKTEALTATYEGILILVGT
ncbi:hypothetical protein ABRO84_17635, partial [Escherichia coli]|uniref:hypothetical protein n=1 Tax=Escherichia coli TaxID=562 RepID=UPI0032EDFC8C